MANSDGVGADTKRAEVTGEPGFGDRFARIMGCGPGTIRECEEGLDEGAVTIPGKIMLIEANHRFRRHSDDETFEFEEPREITIRLDLQRERRASFRCAAGQQRTPLGRDHQHFVALAEETAREIERLRLASAPIGRRADVENSHAFNASRSSFACAAIKDGGCPLCIAARTSLEFPFKFLYFMVFSTHRTPI